LGCYSTKSFTVPGYKQIVEKKDEKSDEIHFITKNGKEFYFSESIINFENDTLDVSGQLTTNYEQDHFQSGKQAVRKFSFSDIESIQSKHFEIGVSILHAVGVGTIFIIVFGHGKPKISYSYNLNLFS